MHGEQRWTSPSGSRPRHPVSTSPGNDPLNQHGSGGGSISLREVLVEMIHEYARHLGHADLLRERIDGRLGQ